MATNIHDSGYKKLFANRTIFRQLVETFVQEPWVNEIDFNQCETLDKSFVSDHYKETESGLIYKVKVRGKTIYIYVLLEFQSSVDRFMVVRVLNYLTNFYLDYVKTHIGYVYRTKEEVRTMLVATLEQERKKIYQAGREEGRVETQRQTILQLLQFRFDLDEAAQARFAQQLFQIQDSQALATVINGLLRSGSKLEEIAELLAKSLPTD